MTADRTPRYQHREELIDSLLHSLHESSAEKAQSLVSAALPCLDDERDVVGSDISGSESEQRRLPRSGRPFSRPVTIGLATCALILIVVSLSLLDQSTTAVAAVQKSLEQAMVDVGRQYRVKWNLRLGGNREVHGRSDLYVRGADRFVFRQNTPLANRKLSFGSDRGQAWVVPPVGPVIEGGNQSLINWVTGRQDITGPYLHISAILQRMRNEYELRFVETTGPDLPSHLRDCQHILGTRKEPSTILAPDEVELWADSETGLTIRLEQRWQQPTNGIGWESININLIDETRLPDKFFTADSHGGKNRTRMSFEAEVIQ